MTEERIVSAKIGDDDDRVERAIRPHRLADYVGQAAVREQMGIAIEASRRRGDALDHVLVFGAPGLGQTPLAHILAAAHIGSESCGERRCPYVYYPVVVVHYK